MDKFLGRARELWLWVAGEEAGEHLLLGCSGLTEDGDLGGGLCGDGENVEMWGGKSKGQTRSEFRVNHFRLREFGRERRPRDAWCTVL